MSEIEALIQKCKKNGKLNREDAVRAEQIITSLLKLDENRNSGFGYMLKLPVEVASGSFSEAWKLSGDNDKHRLIEGIVNRKDYNGLAGFNRMIELIRVLIPLSVSDAFRILVTLAEKATAGASKKPNPAVVKNFRKRLMENNVLTKISLEKENINARQASAIALIVLMGLIEGHPGNAPVEREMSWLDWISRSNAILGLSPKLVSEIEQETARWPEIFQRKCVQLGLIRTVTLQTSLSGDETPTNTRVPGPVPPLHPDKHALTVGQMAVPEVKQVSREDREPFSKTGEDSVTNVKQKSESKLSALKHLETVAEYIIRLEERVNHLNEQLSKAEFQRNTDRNRLNEAEKTIRSLEETVNETQSTQKGLVEQLGTARSRITELEDTISKMKNDHQAQISRLVDQSEHESRFAVEEFRNRLAQSLRLQYCEFTDTDNAPMTQELGEHLRYCIRRIFSTLGNKGINFE